MRCAITIFVCAGLVAAQTPASDPKGSIHGTVKDSNGAPVAGISVQAHPFLGVDKSAAIVAAGMVVINAPVMEAATDEFGNYTLAGLSPGNYSVKADRGPGTENVKLDAGQDLTVDLVIPANPAISGRVLNQEKEPVVDAFVWLLRPQYARGVLGYAVIGPKVTGGDGSYSFDSGLEANRRYYLLVEHKPSDEFVSAPPPHLKERQPIEVSTYYPSANRIDSATVIVLQPGESREHVDILIATAPYFCVSGKIESEGKPASISLTVHEAPLAGTHLLIRSSTGDEGKYRVCGLPPGTYRLSSSESFREFQVASSDVEHIDLSLDMASLRLQVDWDGPPPASPGIRSLNPQAMATLRDIAAAAGVGDNPTDEELSKLASRLNPKGPGNPYIPAALNKLRDQPGFPEEMGNLLSSLTLIFGDVVRVWLEGAAMRQVGTTPAWIPAADYSVNVMSPFGGYVKQITFNDVPLADSVLHLAPAQSGTLHVLMASGMAKLAVTVADADGNPAAHATIAIVPASATTASALSRMAIIGLADQYGKYAPQPLPPGKYRVLAFPQAVRWDSPEDLEKVLPLLFQATDVELDTKVPAQLSLSPIAIF